MLKAVCVVSLVCSFMIPTLGKIELACNIACHTIGDTGNLTCRYHPPDSIISYYKWYNCTACVCTHDSCRLGIYVDGKSTYRNGTDPRISFQNSKKEGWISLVFQNMSKFDEGVYHLEVHFEADSASRYTALNVDAKGTHRNLTQCGERTCQEKQTGSEGKHGNTWVPWMVGGLSIGVGVALVLVLASVITKRRSSPNRHRAGSTQGRIDQSEVKEGATTTPLVTVPTMSEK